jgi:hypothetical protein
LLNYNKALSLNPNNPPLSQFVQALQAKANASSSNTNMPVSNSMASGGSDNAFELDVNAGFALYSSNVGFGGGLAAYYGLDKHLFIGAGVDYYTISATESGSGSYEGETVSASATSTVDFIEVMARAKYVLDGSGMKPYFFVGAGIVDTSSSYSASGSASGGGESVSESEGGSLGSQVDPAVIFGAGLQFPMGKKMDISVQAKESIILVPGQTVSETEDGETVSETVGGGTASYTVIEAGLDFDL